MSPAKKSDVKRHLSTHNRFGKALCLPLKWSETSDSVGQRSTNARQSEKELSSRVALRDDETKLTATSGGGCT